MTKPLAFKPFPKMARLSREVIVTEKIDGTNSSIYIGAYDPADPKCLCAQFSLEADEAPLGIWAGSRTRWITPEDDNFDFARWVLDNAHELFKLGVGHHFGEYWGSGIQRAYGYKNGERFFSLFNVGRWVEHDQPTSLIENPNPKATPKFTENAPACCKVVPILYRGVFSTVLTELALNDLAVNGSVAARGFMRPEGVVVFHVAGQVGFKKTIEGDHEPKGCAKFSPTKQP